MGEKTIFLIQYVGVVNLTGKKGMRKKEARLASTGRRAKV